MSACRLHRVWVRSFIGATTACVVIEVVCTESQEHQPTTGAVLSSDWMIFRRITNEALEISERPAPARTNLLNHNAEEHGRPGTTHNKGRGCRGVGRPRPGEIGGLQQLTGASPIQCELRTVPRRVNRDRRRRQSHDQTARSTRRRRARLRHPARREFRRVRVVQLREGILPRRK